MISSQSIVLAALAFLIGGYLLTVIPVWAAILAGIALMLGVFLWDVLFARGHF